jgi:hypothetical protein
MLACKDSETISLDELLRTDCSKTERIIPARQSVLRGKKLRTFDQIQVIAALRVAAGDSAPNPVHREFGHRSCRMDRRVPCGLAATPL